MKYELNGISLPFGGISWNKTKSKKDIFSFLLIYLESKRFVNRYCFLIKVEIGGG